MMAVSRETENDLTLRSTLNKLYETVVPMRSRVVLIIFSLHRNELVWEEPEVSVGCGLLYVHQTQIICLMMSANYVIVKIAILRPFQIYENWETEMW